MSSDETMELLSHLMDGDLPEEQARALRRRIAYEPELGAAWDELQRVGELVAALPDPDPPTALLERLEGLVPPVTTLGAARPTTGLFPATGSRAWPWLVAAAAVVALAMLIVWPRPHADLVLVEGHQLVDGRAEVLAAGIPVQVDGIVAITVEPPAGGVRKTGQEVSMIDRKVLAAAVVGSVITVAVYEGRALMLPGSGEAIEIAEGQTERVRVGEDGTVEVAAGDELAAEPATYASPPPRRSVADLGDFGDEPADDGARDEVAPQAGAASRAGEPAVPAWGANDDGGEEPAVRYPVDRDGINDAVRASLSDIKECYQSWLEVEPDLAGTIVVGFTIAEVDGAGAVIEVDLTGQTTETNVMFEGCVLNVMSELPFEAPPDGGDVEVNYPFTFRSQDEDSE